MRKITYPHEDGAVTFRISLEEISLAQKSDTLTSEMHDSLWLIRLKKRNEKQKIPLNILVQLLNLMTGKTAALFKMRDMCVKQGVMHLKAL